MNGGWKLFIVALGVILSLVSILYAGQVGEIEELKERQRDLEIGRIENLKTISEMRVDLTYIRRSLDRIEQRQLREWDVFEIK